LWEAITPSGSITNCYGFIFSLFLSLSFPSLCLPPPSSSLSLLSFQSPFLSFSLFPSLSPFVSRFLNTERSGERRLIEQGFPTSGPRATCGPQAHFSLQKLPLGTKKKFSPVESIPSLPSRFPHSVTGELSIE
jgi:hypothetical protein